MITDALTNPTVKAAIEALQRSDRGDWSALFEPNATLYDDGSPRSLETFTRDALGHERFTSIERVDHDGLDVVGAFHSDKWGDFRTYLGLTRRVPALMTAGHESQGRKFSRTGC